MQEGIMQNVVLKGKKVTIRTIEESDIKTLWNIIFKEESPEWKKWDAPYFPFSMQEYSSYKEKMQTRLKRRTTVKFNYRK